MRSGLTKQCSISILHCLTVILNRSPQLHSTDLTHFDLTPSVKVAARSDNAARVTPTPRATHTRPDKPFNIKKNISMSFFLSLSKNSFWTFFQHPFQNNPVWNFPLFFVALEITNMPPNWESLNIWTVGVTNWPYIHFSK